MKYCLILFNITFLFGCATSGSSRGKLSEAFDRADNPDSSSRYIEEPRSIERGDSPWNSSEKDEIWRKDKFKKKPKTTKKTTVKKQPDISPRDTKVIFKRSLKFESGFGYHFLEFGKYIDQLGNNIRFSLLDLDNEALFINSFPLFPYIKDIEIYKDLNGGFNGMYPIVVTEEYIFSKNFEKSINQKKTAVKPRNEFRSRDSFTFGFSLNNKFILHEDYINGVGGNLSLGFIYSNWAFNLKLGPYFIIPDYNLKELTSNEIFVGAGIGFDIRRRLFEINRNMESSIIIESSYSLITFDFKNPLIYYERDSNGDIIREEVIEGDSIGIFSIGLGPAFTYYSDNDYCITISTVLGYSLMAPYTVERFDNDVFDSFPYLKIMVDLAFMID